MSKFGYEEVITVTSKGMESVTDYTNFGVKNGRVYKKSDSIRVQDYKEVISQFLDALKKVKNKEHKYLCFEVFTSEKDKSIHRINIASMKDVDIANS